MLVALAGCRPAEPEFYGTTYETAKPADDFTLTDQFGETFRLSDYAGKVVMLFFGYAHCPDVCPVTLSNWAKVQTALSGHEDLELVFVTVDPERDTVEQLRDHLAIFSDDIRGLTGTPEELEPVYKSFGIYQRKVQFSSSAVGYVVDHTTVMLVIDRDGQIRLSFPFDANPDEIVHDVRKLLDS